MTAVVNNNEDTDVIVFQMGLKKLAYLPPRHAMEMMAKAAVAVYE
jgi:hypothetical protein